MREEAARCALLLVVWACTGSAQGRHVTAFTGRWRLDAGHSRFDPGPAFQSFTITFTDDGARHLDLVDARGKRIQVTLPWPDGKPVTPIGMERTTTVSNIKGRRFHDVWKRDGVVIEDVHGEAARDGRTMKTTVDGRDGAGRKYRNELMFVRE